MTDQQERAFRTRRLASLILAAAGNLERENWQLCKRTLDEAALESRALVLLDKQATDEKRGALAQGGNYVDRR